MKKIFAWLILFFALFGLVDSGYLTYEEFKPQTNFTCSALIQETDSKIDCNQVLSGPYAYIGPVPVALLGFGYYLVVFTLALAQLLTLKQPYHLGQTLTGKLKNSPSWLKHTAYAELIALITGVGLLFTSYLVYLMAFVIKYWCYYCLISAASTTSLFLLSLFFWSRRYGHSPFLIKKALFVIERTLYRYIFKPVVFLFDAEKVHNLITAFGVLMGKCRLTQQVANLLFSFYHPKLKSTILNIEFPNPVGLSAGFDYNGQLTQILPSIGFGWHTIGTVTLEPYEGNPPPRLGRFPRSKALLVNKGLKSLGAKKVIANLKKVKFKIPTAVSIASTNKHFANTKEQMLDILTSFRLFEKSGLKHTLYELNISCPNTFGGEPFTTCPRLDVLLSALDKLKLTKPVLIKMPIDQSKKETLAMLKVIDKHNIAGVIFGNLTKDKHNPAVTPEDRKKWQKMKGNLSGKQTFERSNAFIRLTRKHFGKRFIIVGTGGIFNGADARAKIEAGADLVQLITGMIYNGPQTVGEINLEIATSTT